MKRKKEKGEEQKVRYEGKQQDEIIRGRGRRIRSKILRKRTRER